VPHASDASPTVEQLVCTPSASVRILPVSLGDVRGQRLAQSAHPSLAATGVLQLHKLREAHKHGAGAGWEGCVKFGSPSHR
jgi:hypothetical protein